MLNLHRQLVRHVLRYSRRADEAEDLAQDALLAAVAAGRADFDDPGNRRWLFGTARNLVRLEARRAVRRKRRDQAWSEAGTAEPPSPVAKLEAFAAGLPPSLKIVARLALSGHDRREIGYLLGVPDTALRKRISDLRRRAERDGAILPDGLPGLSLDLPYGAMRDAMRPMLDRHDGAFASHDPDGHFILVRAHKPPARGNGTSEPSRAPSEKPE